MGQPCCCATERKDELPARKPSIGGKQPQNGRNEAKTTSDADAFDTAFERKDIGEFTRLMDSTEPIEPLPERMHPWAADPRSVGPLAATQLAILSSSGDNPRRKDEILAAGAIPKFKKYLESKEEDRVQTAVVALSFLSTDNTACASEIFKVGCLPLLVPLLSAPIQGMRGAVASTLRNMYVQSPQAKKAFLDAGGVPLLVQQLNRDMDNTDLALEGILNMDDLVETDAGDVDHKMAQELVTAGAVPVLRKAAEVLADDNEVREQADELLQKLGG
jgi:hypothetical protein